MRLPAMFARKRANVSTTPTAEDSMTARDDEGQIPLSVQDALPALTADAEVAEGAPKRKRWLPSRERTRSSVVPIQVIIGFLPEVTERDAREYAAGIAEKHFQQLSLAYYDAFKYGNGYAYEAHEGGEGKAFLPEILAHFERLGPFRNEEDSAVVIKTATRMVHVERTREGLSAIILPERASESTEVTSWLSTSSAMLPVINTRTGFLMVGAALFTSGFVAMMVTSMLTRYQPYEEPPPVAVEFLRADSLPFSQWRQIESVPLDSFVRTLRYRNGRWDAPEVQQEAIGAPAIAPTPSPEAVPGLPPPPPLPASSRGTQ